MFSCAKDTVEDRMKKEIVEKENQYKDREESPSKIRRIQREENSSASAPRRRGIKRKQNKEEIKTVIFIPHTKDSSLAKDLREREIKVQEITGDRIKIVEKVGKKLENILTNKDPWKGMDFGSRIVFSVPQKY